MTGGQDRTSESEYDTPEERATRRRWIEGRLTELHNLLNQSFTAGQAKDDALDEQELLEEMLAEIDRADAEETK